MGLTHYGSSQQTSFNGRNNDSPIIASLRDAEDKASRFHGVSAFELPDNNSTQALLGLKDKSFSQARMKP